MTNVVALVPKAAPRKSTAPKGLSRAGKKLWNELEPILADRGVLNRETRPLLASYCGAMAMIAEIDAELSRAKPVIKGANGIPRPHPLIGARNRASQNALQLAKRLGIGLTSAPSKSKGGAGDADPYSDLGI